MGKIDELQDSIDHAVTERDEGIDRPKGNSVDQLLKELVHGWKVNSSSPNKKGFLTLITPPHGRDATGPAMPADSVALKEAHRPSIRIMNVGQTALLTTEDLPLLLLIRRQHSEHLRGLLVLNATQLAAL